MNLVRNLLGAGVAADLATLPASAYDNKTPSRAPARC